MIPRMMFAFGPSSYGFQKLLTLLAAHDQCSASLTDPPLLSWDANDRSRIVRERMKRLRCSRPDVGLIADMSSSYLPYVSTILSQAPETKFVYLKSPTLTSQNFLTFSSLSGSRLMFNHWSANPEPSWYHDPTFSHTFPKYSESDFKTVLDRYVREYESVAENCIASSPENFFVLDVDELHVSHSVSQLMEFLELDAKSASITDFTEEQMSAPRYPAAANFFSENAATVTDATNIDSPERCAVLVPFGTYIHQDCEIGLKTLEHKGYTVRRVGGYSAVDQARNQIATDALRDGFEETFWIDSDIGFEPEDVDKLRSHHLAISCGVYPQKGRRELACHIPQTTPKVVFGKEGGLVEVLYAGAGFLHVRREVYQHMQINLNLRVCNERFGIPMLPYFQPMVREDGDGHWYLAEDYAFCERVRQSGFQIFADTTIRLWHVGNHRYSWENAGIELPRYETFTLQIHKEVAGDEESNR